MIRLLLCVCTGGVGTDHIPAGAWSYGVCGLLFPHGVSSGRPHRCCLRAHGVSRRHFRSRQGDEHYSYCTLLISYLRSIPTSESVGFTVDYVRVKMNPRSQGTAVVLTCSTLSATISFFISRSFGRDLVLERAQDSPQ